jgi:hypothetical protein
MVCFLEEQTHMNNHTFLEHLRAISQLAKDAEEEDQLEDFLDAIQILLQSKRGKLTQFSLDPRSLN